MDNFYLNNAVYMLEARLNKLVAVEAETTPKQPPFTFEVDYGERAEHCWNGDQKNGNHISRLRYNSMYVPKMMARMQAAAPAGADLSSWRY